MDTDKTVSAIFAFASVFAAIWTVNIAHKERRSLRDDEKTTVVIAVIGAAWALKSVSRSN